MVAKMERKALKAYIWDLDGTLLDSYEVIVSSVLDACRSFGICVTEEEANRQVIRHSVTFYLQTVAESHDLPFDQAHALCKRGVGSSEAAGGSAFRLHPPGKDHGDGAGAP